MSTIGVQNNSGYLKRRNANELAGVTPASISELRVVRSKRKRGASNTQVCLTPGCTRVAVRGGKPGLCITHGGGRRCKHKEGCTKAAQGSTHFCIAHGGGKRCEHPNCNRAARGTTSLCYEHTKEKNIGLSLRLRRAVHEEFPSFVVSTLPDDGETF